MLVGCTRTTSAGRDYYNVYWKIVFTGGVYDVQKSVYGPKRQIRHGESYTYSFERVYSETAGSPEATVTFHEGNPLFWSNPGSTNPDHSWLPPDFVLHKSACT